VVRDEHRAGRVRGEGPECFGEVEEEEGAEGACEEAEGGADGDGVAAVCGAGVVECAGGFVGEEVVAAGECNDDVV